MGDAGGAEGWGLQVGGCIGGCRLGAAGGAEGWGLRVGLPLGAAGGCSRPGAALCRRLLEKSQRVEAILGSMMATGAERAQLQEIEEMITAPERQQLESLKRNVNK